MDVDRRLDEYAARDPRVKAIHLGENVGLGRARNIGLDAAGGEYAWFIDSDDWLEKGVLSEVAERIMQARPLDGAAGPFQFRPPGRAGGGRGVAR